MFLFLRKNISSANLFETQQINIHPQGDFFIGWKASKLRPLGLFKDLVGLVYEIFKTSEKFYRLIGSNCRVTGIVLSYIVPLNEKA